MTENFITKNAIFLNGKIANGKNCPAVEASNWKIGQKGKNPHSPFAIPLRKYQGMHQYGGNCGRTPDEKEDLNPDPTYS